MDALNVQDFFAVGLGLDLAGGYLLARGLLTDEADLATARTFAGLGAQSTVAAVRSRVDAKYGLVYLGGGFVLQAVGYVAEAAGVRTGPTGLDPAAAFLVLTVVALVCALVVWRRREPRAVRALAFKVTCLDGNGLPACPPDGRQLMALGAELGDDACDDESYGHYAQRVWSVGTVTDSDVVPDDDSRRRRQPGRKPVRRRS